MVDNDSMLQVIIRVVNKITMEEKLAYLTWLA
jgi:hypothetical protein